MGLPHGNGCHGAETAFWVGHPDGSHGRHHPRLDSAQPDTLLYDDSETTGLVNSGSLDRWVRVRFTVPSRLELRSIYFKAYNHYVSAEPCSIFVYQAFGNQFGPLIGGYALLGLVQNWLVGEDYDVWNDLDLPVALTFSAGEQFFIVIGPSPGGVRGWHVLMDNQLNTDRSAMSSSGRMGPYFPSPPVADFKVRAGVAPASGQKHAFVTLIQAGPPEWSYSLTVAGGMVNRLAFLDVCAGTIGFADGEAQAAGWMATSYGDSVVFATAAPLRGGTVGTFLLSHPWCSDRIAWQAGDSTGVVDGPLPVELASFTAVPVENGIALDFATASERDNAWFEVYRGESPDGPFHILTTIPSHGATATGHRYSYHDADVQQGRVYWYVLADVNLAGERRQHPDWMRSASTSAAIITGYSLDAYPNPFNPETVLRFTLSEAGKVTLQVFDVSGKLVRELTDAVYASGEHRIAFDAGNLPSGLYLAAMHSGTHWEYQKLLLVR